MNILRIIVTAMSAILTILLGLLSYIYMVHAVKTDVFIGVCCFLMTVIFVAMLCSCAYYIIVATLPKKRYGNCVPVINAHKESTISQENRLKRVVEYTVEAFSEIIPEEDIPAICLIAEDFANGEKNPRSYTSKGKDNPTPVDILHYGYNLKALTRSKWSNLEIARFLKRAFPTILGNWSESTIRARLTTEDGKHSLSLLPPDSKYLQYASG